MNTFIFIDFDRTLYDHDTKSIYHQDINALIQAKKNGNTLFLSTGRPHINLSGILPDDLFAGGIFSCGAKVMINNQLIYMKPFDQQDAIDLCQSLLDRKIDFTLDGDTKRFLTPFAMEIFNKRCKSNELEDCEFNLFAKQKQSTYTISEITNDDFTSILKISLYSKELNPCQDFITSLPDKFRAFLNPNKKDNFIGGEIAFRNINKATGMEKILQFYKEKDINTIAIGDSKNDIEILSEAKIGICMGGGKPEAQKAADFITKPISEYGITYALKALNII